MTTITIEGKEFVRLADLARDRGKAPAAARVAAARGQFPGLVTVGRDLYVPVDEALAWQPGNSAGRPPGAKNRPKTQEKAGEP
ncbi:hypothetical protein [Armatimonas sp.]|uniref:hypothetical protein n=1 Tax=Armatimonas sp. TaxID=1872638 RepID=UPI0037521E4C